MQGHTLKLMEIITGLYYSRTLEPDIIFTGINIHAKVFSVKVMSVIIMTDNVVIRHTVT